MGFVKTVTFQRRRASACLPSRRTWAARPEAKSPKGLDGDYLEPLRPHTSAHQKAAGQPPAVGTETGLGRPRGTSLSAVPARFVHPFGEAPSSLKPSSLLVTLWLPAGWLLAQNALGPEQSLPSPVSSPGARLRAHLRLLLWWELHLRTHSPRSRPTVDRTPRAAPSLVVRGLGCGVSPGAPQGPR